MAVRSTNTVIESLNAVMQQLAEALLFPDAAPHEEFLTTLMTMIQQHVTSTRLGAAAQNQMPPSSVPPSASPVAGGPVPETPVPFLAQTITPEQGAPPLPTPMGRLRPEPDVRAIMSSPDEVARMLRTGTR